MEHSVMDVNCHFRVYFTFGCSFNHKKSDNFLFVVFGRALPHLLKMDDFPKCRMSFLFG